MNRIIAATAVLFFLGHTSVAEDKAETPQDSEAAQSAATTEDEPKTPASQKLVCKSGSETRILQKRPGSEGGCEVVYTKDKEPKTVADAKNDLSYCDQTLEKIKSNLVASGFTCQ